MNFPEGKIFLSGFALEEIIRSGLETYPTETTGILFGNFRESKNLFEWNIPNAHPVQIARRDRCTTYFDEKKLKDYDWSFLFSKVGEFHSHVHDDNKINSDKITHLSVKDRTEMIKRDYKLEIISNIYYPSKKRQVSEENHVLSCYIPLEKDKYFYRIDIVSYFLIGKRTFKAKIEIPKNILKKIKSI